MGKPGCFACSVLGFVDRHFIVLRGAEETVKSDP